MTKSELVQNVAHETGLSQALAKAAVEAVLSTVKNEVAAGKPVTLKEFGTFKQVTRAAKKGWNIAKNQLVDIPERQAVKFTPSYSFLK